MVFSVVRRVVRKTGESDQRMRRHGCVGSRVNKCRMSFFDWVVGRAGEHMQVGFSSGASRPFWISGLPLSPGWSWGKLRQTEAGS